MAVMLALLPLVGAKAAAEGDAAATGPAATPAQTTTAAPAAVDWLERAARIYQEEIAGRLAVPREPTATETVARDSEDRAPPGGIVGALRHSVEAALSYISFWVQQANAVLGGPLTELAYGVVGTPAEQAARDADEFVEARRQADEHWKRAVARADAAAAARRVAGPASSAGETPAEAELRRAEARKAELAKIKEDLDRRISEGLKKLEQFQKQEQERQKTSLFTPPAEPDAAERAASDAEKTRVAAEEERARTEAEAAQKAEDARRAEQARQQKVAEQARQQKAEEDQRQAAAKAEQKRLAEEDARKLAEAELAARKADEARRREAQAAEEKRQADAKADAARVAKDAARVAKDAARVAEQARLAEAAHLAEEERVRAEREAAEQQRKQAAEAEQTRQEVEEARQRAEAKAAEQRATEAREAQAKQRWAEARAIPDKRQSAEPGAAKRAESQPADPKVAAFQAAESQAAESPDEAVQRRGEDRQASTDKEAARPAQVADDVAPNVRHRRTVAKAKADVQSVSRKKKLASSRSHRRDVAGRCIRKKTARAGGRRIHVVERGETLWTISRRYMKKGERYDDIRNANGRKIRDPDRIYPCQRLLLPARA